MYDEITKKEAALRWAQRDQVEAFHEGEWRPITPLGGLRHVFREHGLEVFSGSFGSFRILSQSKQPRACVNKELTQEEARIAWAQGKKVEGRPSTSGAWIPVRPNVSISGHQYSSDVLLDPSFIFRLALEPPAKRYRPWTAEEVPVGSTVRRKGCDSGRLMIIGCTEAWGAFVAEEGRVELDELEKHWVLTDGSPCGVEVEP